MKLPSFKKLFQFKPTKRLHANTAARRAVPAVDDYSDEPQTKLSSAFFVVLILHVVAVGGIYAFNSIKASRRGQGAAAELEPAVKSISPTAARDALKHPAGAPEVEGASARSGQSVSRGKPVSLFARRSDDSLKTAPTMTAQPKTYVVAKGDNPVAIARRLGVSYEQLLKINSIEDPKKLQIGQTLKVPPKKN